MTRLSFQRTCLSQNYLFLHKLDLKFCRKSSQSRCGLWLKNSRRHEINVSEKDGLACRQNWISLCGNWKGLMELVLTWKGVVGQKNLFKYRNPTSFSYGPCFWLPFCNTTFWSFSNLYTQNSMAEYKFRAVGKIKEVTVISEGAWALACHCCCDVYSKTLSSLSSPQCFLSKFCFQQSRSVEGVTC